MSSGQQTAPHTLRLIREGVESPESYPVHVSVAHIGRARDNDIVLPVEHISARHVVLRLREGQYFISDLGSTNGSLVVRETERLILGPTGHAELALKDDDLLMLGDIDGPVRLRVRLSDDAALTLAESIVARRQIGATRETSPQLAADRRALEAVYWLIETVAAPERERDDILQRVTEAALRAIPEARGALVVLNDQGSWAAVAASGGEASETPRPSVRICEEVAAAGEAVLFGPENPALLAGTLEARGVGSGICAALRCADEVVGVLQVECGVREPAFGERHLDLVVALAHHATVALERSALIAQLRRAEARLRDENALLRQSTHPGDEVIAESVAMREVLEDLRRAALTDVCVLLQGETGTGKEVAARYLHERSRRAERLIVPVNCGALSETLLDSELFGHRKGAFTGATSDRKGVFEMAAGGTVFLDEVGEMPPAVQIRLLRVLEESKIKRVGEAVERRVDVRIVAATNRDLAALVEQGAFRKDLYYRLRVFPVQLPPLRDRPEDIAPLVRSIVRRCARRMGKRVGDIDRSFLTALECYPFPGNVRELANEIERALVRANDGDDLTSDALSAEVRAAIGQDTTAVAQPRTLRELLDQYERSVILDSLKRHDGRRVLAAEELGLTRQGLSKKMVRLGIV
jgi:transcriptional regulator with GAF, ATPase, and Fis domain